MSKINFWNIWTDNLKIGENFFGGGSLGRVVEEAVTKAVVLGGEEVKEAEKGMEVLVLEAGPQ